MTEERRVVYDDGTVPVGSETTQTAPDTVVERRPAQTVVEQPATRTVVNNDDPVGNAMAASQLIQTIVWSVVVLVLLIVALWALHVYAGLF
jgi:hypothetical protein